MELYIKCYHTCIFKDDNFCSHDEHEITPNGICKHFIDIYDLLDNKP